MKEILGIFLLIVSLGCVLVGLYEGLYKSNYPKATFYIALGILNKMTLLH